jgi:hypothetical protein
LQTIQPTSQLPNVKDAVIIDGTTQPGFAGAPLIELDGSLTTNAYGLVIAGTTGSTIRGLIVNRFQSGAINLSGNGGHLVAGNYIGTNASGTAGFTPGTPVGIAVPSPNNVIGGTTAADRNIISGNKTQTFSIAVDLFKSSGNKVIGNYIGTDVTGMFAIAQSTGVRVAGDGNTVGGATAAERNVFSGNVVGIDFVGGNNNKIQGNFFGFTADGKNELFGTYGLFIEVASTNNLIGGTNPGEGNLIASIITRGVVVTDTSAQNAILGNSILASNIGIDLKFDGVTPNDLGATINDPSDADTGPNNLQNYPVINSVTTNSGNTVIDATLRSEASKTYRIELFSNTFCLASGFGAGRFFVAATNVNTDASGNANINFTVPTASITGGIFTMTATDPANNTSEFSQCKSAAPPSNGSLQFGTNQLIFQETAGTVNIAVTRTNGSAGAVSVNYATSGGSATPGQDYTAKSGKLDFANGETAKTISINLLDDMVFEPNEDFNITLSNPTNGATLGGQKTINVIIGDDDTPTASINNIQVAEGNSGTTNATFTVSLNRPSFKAVSVDFATDTSGTATPGVDFQPTAGTVTFAIGETSKPVTVLINGDPTQEPNETFGVKLSNNEGVLLGAGSTGTATIIDDDTPTTTVQFSQANYNVQEDQTSVTVTVTRSGDLSGVTTVDYATSDKTASQRTDYTIALGSLTFAAGETSRTFVVLVNEDAYVEGVEQLGINLTNPLGGAALGDPATATITIIDDAQEPLTNTVDDAQTFVSQHYHDFLNREPDQAGLNFWTSQITSCGADQSCISGKRNNVSAAFFLSIEFQQTGFLVERLYKESYGNMPGTPVPLTLNEFVGDTRAISQGLIVNQPGWQQQLTANQQALITAFAQRTRFLTAFPTSMTSAQFVDALFANAGVVPTSAERQAAIDRFGGAANTADVSARVAALLDIAQNASFVQAETNRAFVLMQYFGYLRRNPNDAPEIGLNFDGYNFWLNKLNLFGGDYQAAEMVKAFVISSEYRQRFGQ